MDFGQAIKELKAGNKVSRNGWNGKGMYLWIKKGAINAAYVVEAEAGGEPLLLEVDGVPTTLFEPVMCDAVTVFPHICMWTATGNIVTGWLASQTDILAEDWGVISKN